MDRRYLVLDMTFDELRTFLSDFDYRFYEIMVLTVSQLDLCTERPIEGQRFAVEYRPNISGFESDCIINNPTLGK